MTEISKMYENAGIKKCNRMLPCPFGNQCEDCEFNWFPDFTTDKQLKIIEWFISNRLWLNLKSLDKKLDFSLDFGEKLAKLVNRLWESFDNQEKEEIRRILNE